MLTLYTTLLSSLIQQLRPLDPNVCVALGFDELAVVGEGAPGSQRLSSFGLSQVEGMQITNPVTTSLLKLLDETLKELLLDKKGTAFTARMHGASPDNDDGVNDNPYLVESSATASSFADCDQKSRKCFELLDTYLLGGVFSRLYEHLAAVAELRCGPNATNLDAPTERRLVRTATCLFSCVTSVIGSQELTRTSIGTNSHYLVLHLSDRYCHLTHRTSPRLRHAYHIIGRKFLVSILKQISEGDNDDYKNQTAIKRRPTNTAVNKMLSTLFDLIQEIVTGTHSEYYDASYDVLLCFACISHSFELFRTKPMTLISPWPPSTAWMKSTSALGGLML